MGGVFLHQCSAVSQNVGTVSEVFRFSVHGWGVGRSFYGRVCSQAYRDAFGNAFGNACKKNTLMLGKIRVGSFCGVVCGPPPPKPEKTHQRPFSRCACHPCVGARLARRFTFLDLCMSPLCKGHANTHLHLSICACHPCTGAMQIHTYTCRFVRVTLAQGPCKYTLTLLDLCVSPRLPPQGTRYRAGSVHILLIFFLLSFWTRGGCLNKHPVGCTSSPSTPLTKQASRRPRKLPSRWTSPRGRKFFKKSPAG